MSLIEEMQEAAATVAARVSPAVVRIGREGTGRRGGGRRRRSPTPDGGRGRWAEAGGFGRGAGVVVGPGLVVTNAHNLRGRR